VHCIPKAYGQFLKANGEEPVTWKRAATMEDVLREADVVRFIILQYNIAVIILYRHNLHCNSHKRTTELYK
jgi:hypothetical protein